MLHDPQTAGLIPRVRTCGAPVIWRCHVGLDVPNELAREAWAFLEPYVLQADAYVFSRDAFVWDELDPARRAIIAPSIDVFAPKNAELAPETVDAILVAAGLRTGAAGSPVFTAHGRRARHRRRTARRCWRPVRCEAGERYVLQVSRWDSLKDPIGVIEGFARARRPAHRRPPDLRRPRRDGGRGRPGGRRGLRPTPARAGARCRASARERIHLALLPMEDFEENAVIVNALQRAADVVVQKSLAEGFGLTVAEAMWKRRAVVASRIGGIQDQIEHGVERPAARRPVRAATPTARRCWSCSSAPERAAAMGEAAHERVRERFLGTHSLLDYLALFERLM